MPRAGDRIRLHTVAHIVQDPLWLARKRGGVPFSEAATTAFPSATPPILSTSCAVGTQHSRLGKSSVETCGKTFGSDKCKCLSRQSIVCQPDCALRFSRPILRESACAIPNARALGYSWRFFSEADCVRESGLLCARPPLCHAPLCLVTFHVCPQATLLPSRVTNGSFGLHLFCVFIVPCHQDRLCPPRCLSRRQRPCVLKGVLQMATLFAVCSFPRCIHAPWVWSLIVSVRSSWSLEICPLEFVISFFCYAARVWVKVTRATLTLGSAGPSFPILPASPLMGPYQDKRTCGIAS